MRAQEKTALRNRTKKALLFVLLIILILAAWNHRTIIHIYHAYNLFEPDKLAANFRNLDQRFPSRLVVAGEQMSPFEYAIQELPEFYTHYGETRSLGQFIADTHTTGLIVTNGTTILNEEYFHGNTERSRAILWSVSKSVISALVGIAVYEGHIRDILEPVTAYVPKLIGSGYDGVAIKHVLQMSSGIRFAENYVDPSSDFNRIAPRSIGLGGPIEDVLVTLTNEQLPGTFNKYASADTQVLGMVLREAVGMDLAEYTQTRLWQPAGMESDAYWLTDSSGMEVAFGGLNATLRDMARFGGVYLQEGYWNEQQIIPREWVLASHTPDDDHLLPGWNSQSDSVLGYGYQWWVPENDYNDYLALGIHGQAIYVNPYCGIVIAKTAAYKEYYEDGEEMELESISVFRAIASTLGQGCTLKGVPEGQVCSCML